jgi:hypothetical protein
LTNWRKVDSTAIFLIKRGTIMGRLFLGFLLIGAAIVTIFVLISAANDTSSNGLFKSLVCQPGEKFTEVLGDYITDSNGGRGRQTNYYCDNGDGGRRDVTFSVFGIIFAAFGIPLVAGILMMIWGGFALARRQRNAILSMVGNAVSGGFVPSGTTVNFGTAPITPAPSDPNNPFPFDQPGVPVRTATVFTINGQQVAPAQLNPQMAQLVQQVLSGLNVGMSHMDWSKIGLSERLQQLQDARSKNLITEEEFQRLRQHLLDGQ